ncbi:NAD(P)H-binding protein [Streptomyces capparidis]
MTETTHPRTPAPGSPATLVLGATGKTGRRVAARLAARGVPVRAASRSGEPPFDWHAPATWPAALRDVTAVYLVYYPDLAAPEAAGTVRAFTEQAVRAGVRRIVLLSGRGEEEAERAERAVRTCPAEWTVLRASWFSQNFSEDFLREPVLAGEIALPAADVPEPFVDADDIADAAVAALTEPGHAGRTYELTGPRLLTFADAAREIAAATGRPLRYVPLTPAEYAAHLAAHGVPPEHVATFTDVFTRVLDGRNAHTADGVRRALGRDPRDFTAYAHATAATGAWTP